MAWLPSRRRFFVKFSASQMLIRQKSMMPMPPTVTARAMSLRRSPWQAGQGAVDRHSSRDFFAASDCVSR